jgi:hypothetical protein
MSAPAVGVYAGAFGLGLVLSLLLTLRLQLCLAPLEPLVGALDE